MRRRSNNVHAAEGADLAYARLGKEPDHGLPCAQAENPPDDAPTLENPNILVLTDQIDLDDQISKTFVACGLPNPKQASSVAELRDAVARAGNGQILLSTIFKFAELEDGDPKLRQLDRTRIRAIPRASNMSARCSGAPNRSRRPATGSLTSPCAPTS